MSTLNEAPPSVFKLVTEISRLFSQDFNTRVPDYGLTHTQWHALSILKRNEGIKQAVLAQLLQVKPISLGRLIDRMEAAGWVERRQAPNDRRAVQLYLTPKVKPLLDEMTEAAALTRERALSDFHNDERELLLQMLLRVKTNLSGDASPQTKTSTADAGETIDDCAN